MMCQPNWRSGRLGVLCILVWLTCPGMVRGQSSQQRRLEKVMSDAGWLHGKLNDFWSEELRNVYGITFEPVGRLEYYDSEEDAPCGSAHQSAPKNAFYCEAPGDEHIAFDRDWFQGYLVKYPGGATTFLILAHEWGHAVQNSWLKNRGTDTWVPQYRKELNADCLAGVFLAWGYRTGAITEDADDAEALWSWLYSSGSPWLDPRTHGSHEQRVAAFQDGFSQGTQDCRVRY